MVAAERQRAAGSGSAIEGYRGLGLVGATREVCLLQGPMQADEGRLSQMLFSETGQRRCGGRRPRGPKGGGGSTERKPGSGRRQEWSRVVCEVDRRGRGAGAVTAPKRPLERCLSWPDRGWRLGITGMRPQRTRFGLLAAARVGARVLRGCAACYGGPPGGGVLGSTALGTVTPLQGHGTTGDGIVCFQDSLLLLQVWRDNYLPQGHTVLSLPSALALYTY